MKKINQSNYYEDIEYISYSHLKDFIFCEYLYQAKYLDKSLPTDPRLQEAFDYGKAVDSLLTEGEEAFSHQFCAVDRKIDTSQLTDLETELDKVKEEIAIKFANDKPAKMLENKETKLKEKIKPCG